MKIRTTVKAGISVEWRNNHNEKLAKSEGLKIKTGVKAGNTGNTFNHNETLVCSAKK